MSFSRFEIRILLQLLLFAATAFVLAWAILNPGLHFTVVYFAILLVLEGWLLFWAIRKNNRKVREFLLSVKYGDESVLPDDKKLDRSQKELYSILSDIARLYGKVKFDKESEHHYFLSTVKHVNIGLISFDENGKVDMVNDAFKRLFGIEEIRTTQKLDKIVPGLEHLVNDLKPGKSRLLKVVLNNELMQISMNASVFILQGKKVKLVSFQDIKSELQQEEIETWQKLIGILRHEIMNSIGPITSLSKTLKENFEEYQQEHPMEQGDFFDNTNIGLSAIEKRSAGLMGFVETYRTLSKIPKPEFQQVSICDLMHMIGSLMEKEIQGNSIQLNIDCKTEDLKISIDEKLFSQVLINVLKNAIQALNGAGVGKISIVVDQLEGDAILISIGDTGPGVPEEILDKIFLPFFTTKKDGSGIGLSISRQIMQMHGGSISIRSKEGEGAAVELRV